MNEQKKLGVEDHNIIDSTNLDFYMTTYTTLHYTRYIKFDAINKIHICKYHHLHS